MPDMRTPALPKEVDRAARRMASRPSGHLLEGRYAILPLLGRSEPTGR